ncbi:MAG: hypothetical protein K2P81_01685 [Bacteriovoracaceae bacterium]|nr:hypothetical protein [Bacteriovoracaceae bacterium]
MSTVFALILSTIWFSWSLLVDFFIIPNVFQKIPDFFMAGNLGLAVFSKLNLLEFPLATLLMISLIFHFKKTQAQKWLMISGFLLLGIASIYLFSLTPKLSSLTATWEYAEKMGTLGPHGQDVQQLHQNYHRLYIGMDSVKMLLLLVNMSFLGFFISRKA